MKFPVILVALIMLLPVVTTAQQRERGSPVYIRVFDDENYPVSRANWTVTQGVDGRIYVGNSEGVVVFDGLNWELIELPNAAAVRSLAIGNDGIIYVGAYNDFGMLYTGSNGRITYKSLLSKGVAEIGDVWHLHVLGDRVIFQSNKALYVLENQDLKVIESVHGFHTSFKVGKDLWIREYSTGLMRLFDNKLVPIPGGEIFGDVRIYSILETYTDSLIIATREAGLFSYVNNKFRPVSGVLNDYIINNQVYGSASSGNGNHAYATLTGGVVTFQSVASIDWRFSSDNLLSDRVANYVFWDSAGGLWIALHNGELVRVDVPSPLTLYDKQLGSEGNIASVVRFKGNILIATGAGLQEIKSGQEFFSGRLSQVDDIPIAKELLTISEDILFVGTEEGLFEYDGGVGKKITSSPAQAISKSTTSQRVWVGTQYGLTSLQKDGAHWRESKYPQISDDVRSMIDQGGDNLWIGVRNDGVLHFNQVSDQQFTYAKYDTSHGLPVGTPQVEMIAGQPAFIFEDGLFRFDSLTTSFFIDSTAVPNLASDNNALLDVYEDNSGNIWSVFSNEVYVATKNSDHSYSINRHPDLSFSRENVSQIYIEDSGLVWISSGNELVRYDPSIKKSYAINYPPIIRRVTASRRDSVIFYGATMPGVSPAIPSLHYDENDLRFDFAAPEFNAPEKTQYAFKLEGKNDDWSAWSPKTFVDFNNLREGNYRFVVKAKNSMGYVSPEGSYSFMVLPPWYRTWWSFLLFATLFLGLAYFSLKYYLMAAANRRAQEQARELARERIVNEKLQEANEQLHIANNRLTEVNSLKDEFLATTSHELRTPLTAILGYAAILKEEIVGPQREFVEIIEQSSNRLMHTLNSVLDLAKLRSGTTELRPAKLDLGLKVEHLATTYREIAQAEGLTIECSVPSEPVYVYADEYAIATVIDSLLDNAVKFTLEGSIRISVTRDDKSAILSVSDDGVGMDAAFLPIIFDEFRQESDGLARSHTGNGLGLSIVAKMIELLDGSIEVKSEKGVGSDFIVTLSLYDDALNAPSHTRPHADRPPAVNSSAPATRTADSRETPE